MTRSVARRPCRWLRVPGALVVVALLAVAAVAGPARAGCFADALGGDGEFAALIDAQPQRAIERLSAAISRERATPGSTTHRLPQLYAMLAEAQLGAGASDAGAESARLGFAAANPSHDAEVRDRLEVAAAKAQEESDDLPGALARLERLGSRIPPGAPHYRCFLTERGYLRYINDQMGAAVTDLTAAYQAERDAGNPRRQMLIAGILSSVYADVGFHDEARALIAEMIDYFAARNDAEGLGDAYFRRGGMHHLVGDLQAAEADLRRSLAITLAAPADADAVATTPHERAETVAATNLELCIVLSMTDRAAAAAAQCRATAALGRSIRSEYYSKLAEGYLAGSLAALGQPRDALRLLDPLLDEPQHAFSTTWTHDFYLIRSRVREALGDHPGALADTRAYLDRARQFEEQMTRQRVDVLRVRFEADRKTHALWAEQQRTAQLEDEAEQARIGRNLAIAGGGLAMLLTLAAAWAVRRRAALQAQARIARERLGLVSRLTAGVAHEFNNLLTVVQQSTSLLEREPSLRDNPDVARPLQATRDAVRAAAALTNQLLALGGHDRPQPDTVPVGGFLLRIEPDLRRACGASNTLTLTIEPGLPAIAVDAAQLHHALVAVLTNACDAIGTARDGRITLRARPESATVPPERQPRPGVALEIVDDGRGMTDEVLRRAREPFFTTKEIGQGAGLGLSVVDAFARQSGGLLRLASTPGGGATVTLWLPAHAAETEP